MKSTLVSILQQRMDKCTTEQFWAVGILTALNGVLILQHEDLVSSLPAVVIAAASTIATLYGAVFIVHRHKAYYSISGEQAALLQDSTEAPEFLRTVRLPWKRSALTGVVFYVGWIVSSWLATMFVYGG
ncbi:MAG: hypothetical protein IH999_04535 [Proteobacteria bacterium]|nr:hypothetical protein [Pseudomonadota bacterium]